MTTIFPPPVIDYDKGHGRIERRVIQTSTALSKYLTFPYAAQVFRIHRTTMDLDGQNRRDDVAYGITSLSPDQADPERLLKLARGHWHIENSLYWVRDVTFDEDRSQVRTGSGPRVLATLRNLAISIFRLSGADNIARALRYCSRDPLRPLRLIGVC